MLNSRKSFAKVPENHPINCVFFVTLQREKRLGCLNEVIHPKSGESLKQEKVLMTIVERIN